MKMKIQACLLSLVLLIVSCSAQQQQEEQQQQEVLIISKSSFTKCLMLRRCDLDILLRNDVKIDDLVIQSSADHVITFLGYDTCESSAATAKPSVACPLASQFNISSHQDQINLASYSVKKIMFDAVLIGNSTVQVFVKRDGETSFDPTTSSPSLVHRVLIMAPRRPIDIIFDIWRWSFGALISLLMGILLDRGALVKIVKMPKAIVIGWCCQYLCMPLVAFGMAKIFQLPPIEALALFIYGCSPGGAGSNNWTIMFNGDIDLSVILTFVSTLSSIFVMPMYVYTIGRVFSVQANIHIPVVGLLGNLFVTIGPCLIGLAISYKFPKVKDFCIKIAKPFTLTIIISFFTFLFISKFYLLRLIRLVNWISGPPIPWIGYLLGGGIAYLLKLPIPQCKTVAIETGIQNVGVAFLIIFTNLPSPEADYASLPIIAVGVLTNIPLFIAYFGAKVRDRIKARRGGGGGGTHQPVDTEEKPEIKRDIVMSSLDSNGKVASNQDNEEI